MALPGSGEISIGSIYNEMKGFYPSAGSNITIALLETGYYAPINQQSTYKPDGNIPYGFNEWYNYNHNTIVKGAEDLMIYTDGSSIWAESTNTETTPITIYGSYYNYWMDPTPFSVTIPSGSYSSNNFYDPYGYAETPSITYVSISGVSYYTPPATGPTAYWYW